MVGRKRLPAFSAKDQFLGLLESNRVVVVVGETGEITQWFIIFFCKTDYIHIRLWKDYSM